MVGLVLSRGADKGFAHIGVLKVKLPAGVISGQNIENMLAKLCIQVYKERDFSKFMIPFLCVAMDISTGEEVILKEGYLPDAMRARMAIPTL